MAFYLLPNIKFFAIVNASFGWVQVRACGYCVGQDSNRKFRLFVFPFHNALLFITTVKRLSERVLEIILSPLISLPFTISENGVLASISRVIVFSSDATKVAELAALILVSVSATFAVFSRQSTVIFATFERYSERIFFYASSVFLSR